MSAFILSAFYRHRKRSGASEAGYYSLFLLITLLSYRMDYNRNITTIKSFLFTRIISLIARLIRISSRNGSIVGHQNASFPTLHHGR